MDATGLYPSNWLKAEDVGDKRKKVTIEAFKVEEIGERQEKKGVLSFEGLEKGLVLNKTNTEKLIKAFGKETNGWAGKVVELYTIMTQYKKEEVLAIRLEPIKEEGA